MMFSPVSYFDKLVAPKPRTKPKNSWSPTDLGKCLTGVYYSRKGEVALRQPELPTHRVWWLGKAVENEILAKEYLDLVRADGYEVFTQERIEMPELDVTGYLDLRVVKDGVSTVIDLKTVNDQKFWYMEKANLGADRNYLLQVYTYMMATKSEYGGVWYVAKATAYNSLYPIMLGDVELKNTVLDQFQKLNEAWKKQEPPKPCSTFIKQKGVWSVNFVAKYCDYHQLCLNMPDWLERAQAKVDELNKGRTRRQLKVALKKKDK